MSKRHTEEIFVPDIFGESVGNISKKYFKNGELFVAESVVTYKEFDESLLQ